MYSASTRVCARVTNPLTVACRYKQRYTNCKILTPVKQLEEKFEKLKKKNREILEADHEVGIHNFTQNLTTIDAQMNSLKSKGFLRRYRSYSPPENFQQIFFQTCSNILGKEISESDLKNTKLDDPGIKFQLLNELSIKLDHNVHNSRLREMTDLHKLYKFYSTEIDLKNPYDRLHDRKLAGDLPANLHIQKDPVRFTGKGDQLVDQVTAFPRSSTLVSGLYTRNKFPAAKQEFDIYSELDYKQED